MNNILKNKKDNFEREIIKSTKLIKILKKKIKFCNKQIILINNELLKLKKEV
jgi:hypothetical protein